MIHATELYLEFLLSGLGGDVVPDCDGFHLGELLAAAIRLLAGVLAGAVAAPLVAAVAVRVGA